MARILLQTTNASESADWTVTDFSRVAALLREDGHSVVARDRQPRPDGSDAILANLDDSDFDELWLIAVDSGDGLAPADVRAILRFREAGGGVLTARGDNDTGASLLNLGTIGAVNNFSRYNRERVGRMTDRNSGASGECCRIIVMQPAHALLASPRSADGLVEFFPAHRHEGALTIPPELGHARAIVTAVSCNSGRSFNLAVVIEDEPSDGGGFCGRAICLSNFHHLADTDWAMCEQSGAGKKLEIFGDYLRNVARWLARPTVPARVTPARA